jgi:hypothetical protein
MRICVLCGKDHEKGTPCNFTGADPILAGRITIPTTGTLHLPETVHPDKKWLKKHPHG